MKIVMTVEREYEMDVEKVISEFYTPEIQARQSREDFLQESFFELCGFERDEDHIDGTYVWLVWEDGTTEADWSST